MSLATLGRQFEACWPQGGHEIGSLREFGINGSRRSQFWARVAGAPRTAGRAVRRSALHPPALKCHAEPEAVSWSAPPGRSERTLAAARHPPSSFHRTAGCCLTRKGHAVRAVNGRSSGLASWYRCQPAAQGLVCGRRARRCGSHPLRPNAEAQTAGSTSHPCRKKSRSGSLVQRRNQRDRKKANSRLYEASPRRFSTFLTWPGSGACVDPKTEIECSPAKPLA